MQTNQKSNSVEDNPVVEEKSFFTIIVHSFFVIPFLIAVFCSLLFAGMHMLTRENRSVYDYLEDVRTGGMTKRWQGAFELSRMLANPKLFPVEEKFSRELIKTFAESTHDDSRVRQYLALAMGRTERSEFVDPLIKGLKDEKDENIPALLYALGMIADNRAINTLNDYVNHPDARIRSITVVALGNIADKKSIPVLEKKLNDPEANVQWGAALSLAKMGSSEGKLVISQLLNRKYFSSFPDVDPSEQNYLMIEAITAAATLKDKDLNDQIKTLSLSDPNMKVRASALAKVNN